VLSTRVFVPRADPPLNVWAAHHNVSHLRRTMPAAATLTRESRVAYRLMRGLLNAMCDETKRAREMYVRMCRDHPHHADSYRKVATLCIRISAKCSAAQQHGRIISGSMHDALMFSLALQSHVHHVARYRIDVHSDFLSLTNEIRRFDERIPLLRARLHPMRDSAVDVLGL